MEKKHLFTPEEKREFLKILKKYADVIEVKACDGTSLRKKTIAWNRIACEYNTSPIAPYPASSKQLRRLWMNLKQRHKLSFDKYKRNPGPAFVAELENKHFARNVEVNDADEEISTPYFVNVGGSDTQEDSLKTQISGGNSQNDAFTATDSEGRAFDVEFIDETEEEEDVKPKLPRTDVELEQVKKTLLMREYQDRKSRLNELHLLQKRLLMEQIRGARAKANLAELELKQQSYLE